jgi:serine/threonine protein kinase
MPGPATCPDAETLKEFLLGLLTASTADEVAQHLQQCSQCVAGLRALEPSDPVVAALRQSNGFSTEPLPTAVTKVMAAMRQFQPLALAPTVVGESRPLLAPPRNVGELGWLGPYRILRELGSGGMGVVYLAEDPHLQRQVALKVMQPELAAHPVARQRFLREARAAAALENDHVVTIYQVAEDKGMPYMVMPYLQGETLAARLFRERKLPVTEAVRIAREIAIGLAGAHERGLVHRDVKPGNIWLESRGGNVAGRSLGSAELPVTRVKLLDFGLAWVADAHTPLTPPEVVIGTPAYLAPESLGGGTVDARSDLFSLGCVLFEMLTGKLAFGGTDTGGIIKALMRETPPKPPHLVNADVPPWLSDFVMKLIAKDPNERPESAKAVLAGLQSIAGGLPTVAGLQTTHEPQTLPGVPGPARVQTLVGKAAPAKPQTVAGTAPAARPTAVKPDTVKPRGESIPAPAAKPPSGSLSREKPQTAEQFLELFKQSRLHSLDKIEAAYQRWRTAQPKADGDMNSLASWLVENDYLTEYQAHMLKRGHPNHFFLNKYKITDRIGQGRMAGVYKAEHELGQTVAIKVLPPSLAKDPTLFARFQREARLAMKLKHPNIVRTFEVGQAGQRQYQYLVMEYLEGETLEEVLKRRGKLAPDEAARLIFQALTGLQHIHEQGMIHRDLKPGNVMLVAPKDKGSKSDMTMSMTVKLLDIGLGRAFFDEGAGSGELTNQAAALGTPAYLAPEQARDSHNVDIRADIYSLGCTLYHALAGQTVFPDEAPLRQMLRHATETPKRIRDLNPDVPEGLQQVLDAMLAKDPALRYPTPERAAQALQPFLTPGYQAPTTENDQRLMTYLEWLEKYERESSVELGNVPAPPPWDPPSAVVRQSRPQRTPVPTPLRGMQTPPPVYAPPPVEEPMPVAGHTPLFWLAIGFGIAFVSLILGGLLAWLLARGLK